MSKDKIICWNCNTVVDADQPECPQCKAGIHATGGITDDAFEKSQRALQQKLGIDDSQLKAPEPVDDAAAQVEAIRLRLALECPHCGATVTDTEAVFCAKCGDRIIDEEAEAVVRRVLATVEATVPYLVQQELDRQPPSTVDWDQLPDTEKWKTAWGVWWRTLVATIGVYIVLAVILAAVAASQ